MIECQYCRELVSSLFLDEHELVCTENLSAIEMRKLHEIPATKIQSTAINYIKSHSSENEDFTSVERTPSRNKVVLKVTNNNTSHQIGGSPFALKGMIKLKS